METSYTVSVPAGPRTGRVPIPASKSRAHRLLICASLSRESSRIYCPGISKDIQATADCLCAMGADIAFLPSSSEFQIRRPISRHMAPTEAFLPCGESGSTLRFLLPVTGALGIPGVFQMEGRLPERPLLPLIEVLEAHGMQIRRDGSLLRCKGRLRAGDYSIPGNISSQYISGLLFSLPLLEGESILRVTGDIESAGYIAMTEETLRLSGFTLKKQNAEYQIPGMQTGTVPPTLSVESDWSSAAFFCCMGALSPAGVTVTGMNPHSMQGDRKILDLLAGFGAKVLWQDDAVTVYRGSMRGLTINASDVPDLVPVLSVVAAAAQGRTVISHAERLRLKESNRLQTTVAMLSGLGAKICETADGLIIEGAGSDLSGAPCLSGGVVSSFQDHRIAMSAAVAASVCSSPVTVLDAQCTEKSFPGFWQTLSRLSEKEASI